MGQYMTDLYQVDELQGLVRSDALPVRHLWVDFRINGQENKIYLGKFRQEFIVQPHDSLQSLQARVQNWEEKEGKEGKERLRVICAAHLPDNGYEFIQSTSHIDRVILFCGNKGRANNLMRDYSKIRRACFGYNQVIKVVQAWHKETEQSLLFYDLQEVQTFNRHNANIRALTDNHITLKEAKEHFKKYCDRFLRREDMNAFNSLYCEYSQLRQTQEGLLRETVRKEALLAFVTKHLLPARYLMNEVNTLLKSTSNPRKLAYLRFIISDLFAAISDTYKQVSFKEGIFHAVVDLSEDERRRVKDYTNRFVMLTYFLDSNTTQASSEVQLSDSQVIFEISVPKKQPLVSACNGYLLSGQRALFNLGNYLKVTGVSQDGRRLRAVLVDLPEVGGSDQSKKEQCLALNRQWLKTQQQKYEGQCYSLLLHDDKEGLSFIGSKIMAVQNEKPEVKQKATFKWTLTRQRWRIRNGNNSEEIEQKLETLLQGTDSNKATLLLTLCELFYYRGNDSKFRSALKRLLQAKDLSKEDQRVDIFKLYDQFLAAEKSQKMSVFISLDVQEDILTRNRHYLTSEAYHLLLSIKMRVLGQFNRYEDQLQLVGKLIAIFSICEGTTSPEITRLNKLKVEIVARKDEELNLKEMDRKKIKCSTQVPLDQLFANGVNQPLPIDASKLDLTLFN